MILEQKFCDGLAPLLLACRCSCVNQQELLNRANALEFAVA